MNTKKYPKDNIKKKLKTKKKNIILKYHNDNHSLKTSSIDDISNKNHTKITDSIDDNNTEEKDETLSPISSIEDEEIEYIINNNKKYI